ncbi:hypothetical protein Enr10x_21480 [Gimesia panareensis]|uniref:Uncharacterized protein n=1 Tax=Gimesia panareensis TaxID=2527978 RepID=A0A517Q5D9_9PLAN|nr:hypothetical protein [Gimesia panareensis]QDT26838.1 hypothetical protein Enr10x_21480 [Gimesia panareensis]
MLDPESMRILKSLAEKEGLSPEDFERLIRNDDHFGLGQSAGPGHINIPGYGDRGPARPQKNDLNASSGDDGKKKKPTGESE